MILEKQTEANIQQEGQSQDSIGMSLDLDSAQMLMQMLSKNLYSDAIGSTIREWASNALDSHRRAGVEAPIVVGFKIVNDQYEFSVEDFGLGLDDQDVKNIISKYGKSTKRNSATELGMFGLGFKAGLAYSSSFYFQCRKNGVERKYMMYEGEDVNTIDLLYEKPTTERNGVKMILPVAHRDRSEFNEKICEQLAYFQNVYFDVAGEDYNSLTIFRSEHFQWSSLSPDNYLHISLDDVYYPLDFSKLGLSKFQFPVALRFGLTDGIFPTPNRESIRYTKEAKEVILKKLEHVANFFVEKYNEEITTAKNISQIVDFYCGYNKHVTLSNGIKYDLDGLNKFSTVQISYPKVEGISLINLKDIFQDRYMVLGEYACCYIIQNDRWREAKASYFRSLDVKTVVSGDYYGNRRVHKLSNQKISGHMKDYLKMLHSKSNHHMTNIVKKVKDYKLGKIGIREDNTYMGILKLDKHPRTEWRQRIQEFQYLVKLVIDTMEVIDDIQIPQAFIDSKKKVKVKVITASVPGQRRVKLQGEITGKEAAHLERHVDGQNCKFVPAVYKLEDMHKKPYLMVYGSQADKETLDMLFGAHKLRALNEHIRFVIFSEKELTNLSKVEIHNVMTLNNFMKGDNKPFRRIVTSHLIDELSTKHREVFSKLVNMLPISKDLHYKMKLLKDYEQENEIGWMEGSSRKRLFDSLLEIANANNAFDMEIYPVYLEVKNILDKYAFINCLFGYMRDWKDDENKELQDAVVDLLKYNKFKVNTDRYNVKLTEETLTEQPLEEETIDELQD